MYRGGAIMTRKLSLLLGLIVFISFILTGCNSNNNEENLQANNSDEIIELTDMVGRKITLERPVERVVAVGSALRLYTYINGTNKLVGVERGQQSPDTGRPYIIANPDLQELPIVGEGFPATPDPELLIEAEADVIIAGDIVDIGEIEDLEKRTGTTIVVITTGNEAVFDKEMYESLKIIGKVIGKENRAEELIEYMEDCKTELMELTKNIPQEEKPSIYIGGLSYKGNHGIESTYGNSPVLDAIGAKNVADEIGKAGSIMVDKEQIIEWDPNIIVIDENGLPLVKEDYEKNPDYYNGLTAIRNGQVYGQLPYISYYNNIETAMANIYFLGKILYPKAFENIDVEEKADEIYEFILGKPLYGEMAEIFGGYIKINLNK